MKTKFISLIGISMLIFGAVFFTGCDKEQETVSHPAKEQKAEKRMIRELNIFDQYKFEIVVTETGVIYPEISDELFTQITSGYISLPSGTKPSAKFKTIILEEFGNLEKRVADKKGFFLEFTAEDVQMYESELGITKAEDWYNMLKSKGIDPFISEEEQNKILEKTDQERRDGGIESRNTDPYISTYVPHYYEYNSAENPNLRNWCGHASLKGVAHKHGTLKTLTQIHNAFCNNSSAGYCSGNRCTNDPGSYCANLSDLHWMADNTNGGSWNYNFTSSTIESVSSLANFYQRARDGIDNHKPLIIPSTYLYAYGHFYAVVGYTTIYSPTGSIDYNASKIYLRDVAISAPYRYVWDKQTSVSNFYSKRNGNQVLFVRPGLV